MSKILEQYGVFILIGIIVIGVGIWVYMKYKTPQQNKVEKYDPTVSGKHNIVLYYADWCGWSQKFLPIWEEFSKQVNNTMKEKVVASKIDCATDNSKCNNVGGFPTVLLHMADGKTISYNGNRTLKDLMEFLTAKI